MNFLQHLYLRIQNKRHNSIRNDSSELKLIDMKNTTIYKTNVGFKYSAQKTFLYCLMILQYIHCKLSCDEDDEQQHSKIKPIKQNTWVYGRMSLFKLNVISIL